jgi:NTP pyrophosphatase (non-canonical NTP hydrolase)
MDMNHYQAQAARTLNPALDPRERLINGALGLAGESGEAADVLKKHLFHGHPLDRDALKKELGDVLWYVAALASAAGLTLDEVAQHNLDKLRARYPDGFDTQRSQERAP